MTTIQTDMRIRTAETIDRDEVAATVAAAFFDDPVIRWLLPDVERREQFIEPVFRLYVEPYLAHGRTYLTEDGNGAAVWLPPHAELMTAEEESAFVDSLGELVGDDIERFVQMHETFDRHHPDEPLYYLNFLATVPAFQGRGIGSVFLRQTLVCADREGAPAYHEATTPRNRALYERHGYVTVGEFNLPNGGPPLWRMWRSPR